jgi:hypothetical protein
MFPVAHRLNQMFVPELAPSMMWLARQVQGCPSPGLFRTGCSGNIDALSQSSIRARSVLCVPVDERLSSAEIT